MMLKATVYLMARSVFGLIPSGFKLRRRVAIGLYLIMSTKISKISFMFIYSYLLFVYM